MRPSRVLLAAGVMWLRDLLLPHPASPPPPSPPSTPVSISRLPNFAAKNVGAAGPPRGSRLPRCGKLADESGGGGGVGEGGEVQSDGTATVNMRPGLRGLVCVFACA